MSNINNKIDNVFTLDELKTLSILLEKGTKVITNTSINSKFDYLNQFIKEQTNKISICKTCNNKGYTVNPCNHMLDKDPVQPCNNCKLNL